MADINEPTFDNISGYNTVQFAYKSNISSLPLPSDNIITEDEITLVDGEEWYNFYGTPKTIIPGITSKKTDAGTEWNINLKLRYPKEQAAITNIFIDMTERPLLLKISDNNGVKRLFGTLEIPLFMKFDILNPGEVADYNGYQVEFETKSSHPPYYLE